MDEEWRWVRGFEGMYEVSSFGRVRSYVISTVPRVIKTYTTNYERVAFTVKRKTRTWLLHRLVAQTFIPNPLNLPEVNHKDGKTDNNHVENLEWVTRQQNAKHGYDMGLLKQIVPKGGRGYCHKLTDAQVLEIRVRYANKEMGAHRLGKIYGVSKPAIYAIVKRRIWAHI